MCAYSNTPILLYSRDVLLQIRKAFFSVVCIFPFSFLQLICKIIVNKYNNLFNESQKRPIVVFRLF